MHALTYDLSHIRHETKSILVWLLIIKKDTIQGSNADVHTSMFEDLFKETSKIQK